MRPRARPRRTRLCGAGRAPATSTGPLRMAHGPRQQSQPDAAAARVSFAFLCIERHLTRLPASVHRRQAPPAHGRLLEREPDGGVTARRRRRRIRGSVHEPFVDAHPRRGALGDAAVGNVLSPELDDHRAPAIDVVRPAPSARLLAEAAAAGPPSPPTPRRMRSVRSRRNRRARPSPLRWRFPSHAFSIHRTPELGSGLGTKDQAAGHAFPAYAPRRAAPLLSPLPSAASPFYR